MDAKVDIKFDSREKTEDALALDEKYDLEEVQRGNGGSRVCLI